MTKSVTFYVALIGIFGVFRITLSASPLPDGLLYPRETETRELKSLDGMWNFRLAPDIDPQLGFRDKWFLDDLSKTGDVIPMPVPASYNDVTLEQSIRDQVGFVWYDRKFTVPKSWTSNGDRVWLRFGSVHYAAQVFINGRPAMSHQIGHLPFEGDITDLLVPGLNNRLTVACDNTLRQDSVPPGWTTNITTEDGFAMRQGYSFDFFNYAGIHRSVVLYTKPNLYIDDVTIETSIEVNQGIVSYIVTYGGIAKEPNEVKLSTSLYDADGLKVESGAAGNNLTGKLVVPDARLWWPYLMHDSPGYLYTLEITLFTPDNPAVDIYRLPVGIRTVTWSSTTLFINGKKAYLRGVNKHEDSDLRGKGLDLVLLTKDYNLIRWVGANAYRTSHYPYSEEAMQFADQQGIMIIDECPGVALDTFSDELLANHKQSLSELIRRDKNSPAVIMWSIANEPSSDKPEADSYFGAVAKHVKDIERSRPITAALIKGYQADNAGQHLDIISFNQYIGWYTETGDEAMITRHIVDQGIGWHNKHNKPTMVLEYGADTMEGLHLQPASIWSEEYQVELMSKNFKAFDELREKGWFIGEFIWNFADFKTAQDIRRVGGNKKGLFTRQRQPKQSAHHIRNRYFLLAQALDGRPLPKDLFKYLLTPGNVSSLKTEL